MLAHARRLYPSADKLLSQRCMYSRLIWLLPCSNAWHVRWLVLSTSAKVRLRAQVSGFWFG